LQWHLTDDVGWRIEISKYPRLTEIGAWRGEGEKRYGGFYTKAQLREIVRYAQDHLITIIPEIEMPGHVQAAIASYPYLACTGQPVPVLAEFKLSEHPLCPSNMDTYEFIRGVLDEVMEVFPSPVVHVGGDECPREPWKQCPRCQEFMRERGLGDEDTLQDEFTRRVGEYLHFKGRRMQGWAEITRAGALLPDDAIVQQWLNASVGAAAARAGYDVVVSQHEFLNLDATHEKTPMRKTYEYEPVPAGTEAQDAKHFIGVQAQLWTEGLATTDDCDRNAWPRLLAVAEMAWTAGELMARLERGQYARLAGALRADPRTVAERGRAGSRDP
jgi:hexosaminidase